MENLYRRAKTFARKYGESKSYPVSPSYKIRRYWAIHPTALFPTYWAKSFGDGPEANPQSTGIDYV